MKKSELSFKCILGSPARNKKMYDAIIQAGIKNCIREEDFVKSAICLRIDNTWGNEVSPTYAAKITEAYEESPVPEITFEAALKMLASVEPAAPEFDIKPFDKIIYRIDDHHTTNWVPGFFAHIREYAWAIGEAKAMAMFAKYEGNEKFVGKFGFKKNPTDYPDGWWECENGKPVWKTK